VPVPQARHVDHVFDHAVGQHFGHHRLHRTPAAVGESSGDRVREATGLGDILRVRPEGLHERQM
jgi:hypothetical protein